MEMTYKHWEVTLDNQNILWAGLNREDKPVNSINHIVLEELEDILTSLTKTCAGLVIFSKKKTGFIAGADIQSLTSVEDVNVILDFIYKGQAIFNQLEQLTVPTVAVINGFCLGGGMELALACDYRVAIDNDKTILGLPEIKLGIHPGWGGTVRLPKLVSPPQALQMMLTGTALNGKKAKKIGLIDEYVPQRLVKKVLMQIMAGTYYSKRKPVAKLWNTSLVRRLIGAMALRNVIKKGVKKKHYPAFFQLIEHFENTDIYSSKAMDKEATSFGKLLKGDNPKNLIRLFFITGKIKIYWKTNQSFIFSCSRDRRGYYGSRHCLLVRFKRL